MKYLLLSMALLLIAVALPAQVQVQSPNGYYGPAQTVLSPQDQQQFDKYYAKWVDATRKNDQDDVAENARHMQEIMARYNIPSNIPFAQIASNSGSYSYPNGASAGPYPAYNQVRLSPNDQQKFDKAYSKWLDAQRNNDQDDVASNARKMQEIMARYSIPSNVPFQAIATNGYAVAPNGAYVYPANNPYPYSANPYVYAQGQRLSAKDQKDFDSAYRHWVNARRKKDMDDVDKNARKMQEIMARYNIPANVSFDQIATQSAAYR